MFERIVCVYLWNQKFLHLALGILDLRFTFSGGTTIGLNLQMDELLMKGGCAMGFNEIYQDVEIFFEVLISECPTPAFFLLLVAN
jgi:hypothetical protein